MTDLTSAHQTRLTVYKVVHDRDLPAKLFSRAQLEDPARDLPYRP